MNPEISLYAHIAGSPVNLLSPDHVMYPGRAFLHCLRFVKNGRKRLIFHFNEFQGRLGHIYLRLHSCHNRRRRCYGLRLASGIGQIQLGLGRVASARAIRIRCR